VAGLREVVVVVVTELGVERVATGSLQRLVVLVDVGPQTTVYSSATTEEPAAAAASNRMYILHLRRKSTSARILTPNLGKSEE